MSPQLARSRRYEECVDPRSGQRHMVVHLRGADLKNDPLLNKGTCFSEEERREFELEGLLPPGVATPEQQEARVYDNFLQSVDDIHRYLFLASLQDRNETLFHRLLARHLEEMAPIVYTPTVGKVCERYSRIYRRPRGIYVTQAHRGRIAEVLRHAPVDDCQVIVVTDNEAILGLGDLGVGGMAIPIGKLTLYTAGAGIHPASCLPIDLDPGTNNQELLEDPLYLGVRQRRLSGEAYFSLLDELVEAIASVFPGALVQWEDFANENAFAIMERYRTRLLSFNDDIYGTGAVLLAGVLVAIDRVDRSLADERVVFLGVGAAGGGCALSLRASMCTAGLSPAEAANRVLCLDSKGLLLTDRPGLSGHKRELAVDPQRVEGWSGGSALGFELVDVVRNFQPTILVGMSGRAGAFTKEIVRLMLAGCARPVLMPLSNPTSRAEARPEDLLRWTAGAAIVATGSPFPPVELDGETYEIGQTNNVLIFPGIGLGALAVGASHMPDEVFLAAARALVEATGRDPRPGAPLFPSLQDLRRVSRSVATGVARSLVAAGAAPALDEDEIERRIAALVWEPQYLPFRRA